MDQQKKVDEFKAYLEKIVMLGNALGLMHWDAQTGASKGGTESRAKRMGYFSGEIFALETSDEMKGFIEALDPIRDSLDENTRAMLRICKKQYDSFAKVPVELYAEYSKHCVEAEAVWEEAREKKDFGLFAPYLQKTLELTKEMIKYRNNGVVDYNVLLEDYEPGFTTEILDQFFQKLKTAIVPLVAQIKASGKKIDLSFTSKAVPIEKQRELSLWLADKIGYDFNRGMLGESAHPFSTAFGRDDSRITTKYHENDFLSAFFSVMHECGHAIYEQNKRDDIADTLLDTGISMGVHESQSRFYENIIGRSLQFWAHIADNIKSFLPEDFQHITAEMFYEAAAHADTSFIRIEADELTYPLHIMVRYEMEKLMFSEDVDVMDLPGLWNQKMEEYLGVTPPDDAKGILQDIHWADGLIGYFPSYAIGSALSAQLLHYMQEEFDVYADIRKGDISNIAAWLKKHIHQYGSVYEPGELIQNIKGEGFNPQYYTEYIRDKFSKLYGL